MKLALSLAALLCTVPHFASAAPAGPADPTETPLHAVRATRPPILDGAIDDDAWRGAPLPLGDWLSHRPRYGDRVPQTTLVWVAFDSRYLYVAFRCLDPEPGRLKAGVKRRDTIFSDDFVGFGIDPTGTRQSSYEFFINPSGIQADALNTGTAENESVDWTWDAAARQTASGYEAEVRVPLDILPYRGGENVQLGVFFFRRISRLGTNVAWPNLLPGKGPLERHATLMLGELEERRPREIIPSVTASARDVRATPERFGARDVTSDVGATFRLGVASGVTAQATINPDFSQVESDAYQVETNQRFPVYYPEKRPFFMEGTDVFTLAGTGALGSIGLNMRNAVHTRKIADPTWGAKVTGRRGAWELASLAARDQGQTPGDATLFAIGRGRYTLRPGSYVGFIAADTEGEARTNRVAGADVNVKLDDHQRIRGQMLYSTTAVPGGDRSARGWSAVAGYALTRNRFEFYAAGQHYGDQFLMAPAFYDQAAFTRGTALALLHLDVKAKRASWVKRVSWLGQAVATDDRGARAHGRSVMTGVYARLSRQGNVQLLRFSGRTPWAGQTFDSGNWQLYADAQLFRWVYGYVNYYSGGDVYYDPVAPFQGRARTADANLQFDIGSRLSQSVGYTISRFDRASTGSRVYEVRLANWRTTYQVTKAMFGRATLRFDSMRRRVAVDALASYEPRPGTILFAGYGSVLEQQDYRGGRWVPGTGAYITTTRSLFLKASYGYRF